MTRDQLAQELATELGEQYGDLDVADQFQKWVDEAYLDIAASARWFWLNALVTVVPVAAQAEYSLTDTSEVRIITINSDPPGRVAYSTVERLISRGETLVEEGTPRAWYKSGGSGAALKISLWPVPSAAFVALGAAAHLKVFTVARPTGSIAADPVTLLMDEFIPVLRDGVRYRARMADEDTEGARAFHTLYSEGLSALVQKHHGPEAGGSSLRVKRIKAARQSPATAEEG